MLRVALVVALLTGCAAAPRTQPGADAYQLALANARTYCATLLDDPRLEPLRSKVPLNLDEPTFEMLSLTAKVTFREHQALSLWAAKAIDCNQAVGEAHRAYAHPLVVNAFDTYSAGALELRVALYNGEISWGRYHRERQKLAAAAERAHVEIRDALLRDEQHRASAARESGAAQVSTFLEEFRASLGRSTPAAPVNCVTQAWGGVVTTSCR